MREFYLTPGGEVGSIGVWQAHFDCSQAFAAEGIQPTLISAGKYKVDGNPYAPLDEEAQEFMQSRVDDCHASFTKAVARGRGAPIAQAQGMVEGVATFDEVVRKMRRDARASAKKRASRLAYAQRAIEIL